MLYRLNGLQRKFNRYFTYGMNPISKEWRCMLKKQGGLRKLEDRNIVKETKLVAREGERIS